jgi:hypothetical protein
MRKFPQIQVIILEKQKVTMAIGRSRRRQQLPSRTAWKEAQGWLYGLAKTQVIGQ